MISFLNLFELSIYYLEKSKYVKMGKSEICPLGKEITTKSECEDALKDAYLLGITLKSSALVYGSWDHVPYQCSYQPSGDQAFYFNQKEVYNAEKFVNGEHIMICKEGKNL